eukprot:m.183447 g.183447  ORF g.183447 m.183447 type:complete len:431 (-) comp10496_c0_seq2:742-2034(-)
MARCGPTRCGAQASRRHAAAAGAAWARVLSRKRCPRGPAVSRGHRSWQRPSARSASSPRALLQAADRRRPRVQSAQTAALRASVGAAPRCRRCCCCSRGCALLHCRCWCCWRRCCRCCWRCCRCWRYCYCRCFRHCCNCSRCGGSTAKRRRWCRVARLVAALGGGRAGSKGTRPRRRRWCLGKWPRSCRRGGCDCRFRLLRWWRRRQVIEWIENHLRLRWRREQITLARIGCDGHRHWRSSSSGFGGRHRGGFGWWRCCDKRLWRRRGGFCGLWRGWSCSCRFWWRRCRCYRFCRDLGSGRRRGRRRCRRLDHHWNGRWGSGWLGDVLQSTGRRRWHTSRLGGHGWRGGLGPFGRGIETCARCGCAGRRRRSSRQRHGTHSIRSNLNWRTGIGNSRAIVVVIIVLIVVIWGRRWCCQKSERVVVGARFAS